MIQRFEHLDAACKSLGLSRAQGLYIIEAARIQQYSSHGVYFLLYVPGQTNTGRSLLRKGVLRLFGQLHPPVNLTDKGWSYYTTLHSAWMKDG
jgi:hypothetical protein